MPGHKQLAKLLKEASGHGSDLGKRPRPAAYYGDDVVTLEGKRRLTGSLARNEFAKKTVDVMVNGVWRSYDDAEVSMLDQHDVRVWMKKWDDAEYRTYEVIRQGAGAAAGAAGARSTHTV